MRIYDNYDYAYLFESLEGPRRLARYSFIGFDTRAIVRARARRVDIIRDGSRETFRVKNPLAVIKRILPKTSRKYPRFIGGAVGYLSYDAVRYWEKLPMLTRRGDIFPFLEFGVFDKVVVYDHTERRVFYFCLDGGKELQEILRGGSRDVGPMEYSEPRSNIPKEKFEQMVEKAKQYIYAGDIFQVVLSRRYEFKVRNDFLSFYSALRDLNPSPYMYFLKFENVHIVGSSPEMLVRVDGNLVETFPIAGTRPFLENPVENRKLQEELLSDPKELAEHIMLVDLARNDIGRVAKYGTVDVPELMKIHKFSHVQHIVSRVVGKLRRGKTCFDALSSVFPAGTVTGAPKVRAMEIIEELEPVRRGPYAGAVGYFSFNGNADFAIAIRTLFAKNSYGYVQAGAGIVADSVPEKEWLETEHKAKALLKAMEIARGG